MIKSEISQCNDGVKSMNITIVGGGNVGTQFAVHCAKKQHRVIIHTSKPECFHKHLCVVDKTGATIHEGDIIGATSDAEKAFSEADVIFVTVPAFCMEDVSDVIYPYVKKGVKIGLIPGTGGGECAFGKCLKKGAVLFGLQRVPSVARLAEYGKSVCATGYRKELHAAALPHHNSEEVREIISHIFDMPCLALPNYLNLTLTPSNPILHTARLRTLFKDYQEGVAYDSVPLFYEGWDDEASELLFACDDEVQKICTALDNFDLSYVKSLRIHYESETPEQLTGKISSIQSLKGLKTPTIAVDGKYIPDLLSRYFVADFAYGLEILIQIADLVGVQAPYMKEIMSWYDEIALVKRKFCFTDYGINNITDFIEWYKR